MGWRKWVQDVEEIHWQDDKSFSSEIEADLPEEEECQGQKIKDRFVNKAITVIIIILLRVGRECL